MVSIHTRSKQCLNDLDGLVEALDLARLTGARVQVSHATLVCDTGKPQDVITGLLGNEVIVSTDCGKADPGQGHPQTIGSYPRFFRQFVFDEPLLSLPEAARRTSLLPARVLGLFDRGTVEPGAVADLVLIDPETYDSKAGFPGVGDPDLPPTGVEWVWIGGKAAIENGTRNEALLGKQLVR